MDKSELESQRIKENRCPRCGADMKDKYTYMRCTVCSFSIDNGTWSPTEGWCSQIIDEDEM